MQSSLKSVIRPHASLNGHYVCSHSDSDVAEQVCGIDIIYTSRNAYPTAHGILYEVLETAGKGRYNALSSRE